MNIDTQEINENIIPKINTSINKLKDAINNVKKIEIPKGFAYEVYLKNMPNNVTKIKNNVNDVKNKLTNTVTKFKEVERKNNQAINNLTSKIEGIGIKNIRKTATGEKDNTTPSKEEISISNLKSGAFVPAFGYDSILKKIYDNSIPLSNAKEKKYKNLLDDPKIKEQLKSLNRLIDLQNILIDSDLNELTSKITSKNPALKKLMENFEKEDFKDLKSLQEIKSELEKYLTYLKQYIPPKGEKIPDIYNIKLTNGKDGPYELSRLMGWEIEDYNNILDYLKKNNLTWHDLVSEYEDAIIELEKYTGSFMEKKNAIYNLEQAVKLCPYDKIKERSNFEEYLKRDYSNIIINEPNFFQNFLNSLTFNLYKLDATNLNGQFNDFTQEEKATFVYLLENYSREEAFKYFEAMTDQVNQRKGEKQALEYIKSINIDNIKSDVDLMYNFIVTTGMGFKDGVWQFGENIYNIFPGNGEVRSELQYKQAYLMQLLTQEIDLEAIKEKYGENSEEYEINLKISKLHTIYKEALGINYNVAASIGNEAVPMAASFIPVAGQYIGVTLSGLSSAGAAKANAYQNGITGFKAYVYAGIQGITSAYITKKFKAIPGLSDNTSTTIKGILKSMTQARYFSSSTKQN